VDRAFHPAASSPGQLAARSDPSLVSGGSALMFHGQPQQASAAHRALASAGSASRPQVLQPPGGPRPPAGQQHAAPAPLELAAQAAGAAAAPGARTVGTQSDYRDSEAQTGPWAPGYLLPAAAGARQAALSRRNHCEGPELLQLEGMHFELVSTDPTHTEKNWAPAAGHCPARAPRAQACASCSSSLARPGLGRAPPPRPCTPLSSPLAPPGPPSPLRPLSDR
jgi:hypothetical protein